MALVTKGRTGSTERTRHHEQIARAGAAPAGDPFRTAERSDGEIEALGDGGVAAEHRHPGLVQALVELEHVFELRLRRRAEPDNQPFCLGARSGEVAQVDRCGAVAELAVGRPREPEVHLLDERVLRDDEPALQLSSIVLDPAREPPALELVEEAELAELREPHRPPLAQPRHRWPPARPQPP